MYGFTTRGDLKLLKKLLTLFELPRGGEVEGVFNGLQVGEVV